LSDSVKLLPGVGAKRGELLSALGIECVEDLLYHMPIRYEDRRSFTRVGSLAPGCPAVVSGVIKSVEVRPTNRRNVHIAVLEVGDDTGIVGVAIFGGLRRMSPLKSGANIILFGTPSAPARVGKKQTPHLEFSSPEYELSSDSRKLAARWHRLLPVYPTTEGMPRAMIADIIYKCAVSPELIINDPLPAEIIEKYSFISLKDAFVGIHAPSTYEEIEKSRNRLAYQEFWDIQLKTARYRAQRCHCRARSLSAGSAMLERFKSSLPFTLTASQESAVSEISKDLDGVTPMRRLLMGDVGSGKTSVAIAAIAKCAGASLQAAVLVPTTILAEQFYDACRRYLSHLDIVTAEISGSVTGSARARLVSDLVSGEVDVLVGTHAMLSDMVEFKSLGLLVIDEQHRFGVLQRESLVNANSGVHTLMMSATPIPRTLCMAYHGDIDISEIRGLPDGRKGVITRVVSSNHLRDIYSFAADKISRSGVRCYWVCGTIGDESSDEDSGAVMSRARDIEHNIRDIPVLRLFGTMNATEKSEVLRRFRYETPGILVSTTVIEVGVDIPDAGIIVIEGASGYGLAALHQMRGRVGRGTRAGICILLDSARNIKNSRRLQVLLECDDGFRIAEFDLELRGAGEVSGVRQHGPLDLRVADAVRDRELMEAAIDDVKTISIL
jgi:ATP-dependent DNA helicase RecG